MKIRDVLDSLGRDLRYALRALTRRPGFTLAAVLTLALGIGATTAIFSVVYSVLIKPLPYPNADELVRIRHPETAINNEFDWASSNMYLTYRQENRTFAHVGLWQESSVTLAAAAGSERLRALRVTDGTLQALGIQPIRGRWFTEAERGSAAEGPWPVILSHAFWQRRFGGDETVLGRELLLELPGGNGTLRSTGPSKVIGIMPPDFRFLDATLQPDVIVAVRLDPDRQAHGIYAWQMLARLKPGVALAEAQADLDRMRAIWFDAWPPFPGTSKEQVARLGIMPVVHPLQADLVGGVASALWLLMGAIGAVLTIACANIANLMLVRADARRSELAVRAALGAVPGRIARELLVESLCVGTAGALLGLVLAYLGLRVLVAIGPVDLPRLQEVAIYPPVLAFTLMVSLASTLLFGSITVLKNAFTVGTSAVGAMRGVSSSRERNRTRGALVVVQVALALVLVVSASLMIRTFQALRHIDPGFSDPATIYTAKIWIPTASFPDAEQVTRMEHEILDEIAALPGIASAGFASEVPLEGLGNNGPIAVEGETPATTGQRPGRKWRFVSPGYFETMGTRIVAGRDLTWTDIDSGGRVALISANLAREIAGEPSAALGKHIRLGPFSQDDWREVIGVVQSIHEDGLEEAAPTAVYWPVLAKNMFGTPLVGAPAVTFAVRSERAGTESLAEEVRQAVRQVSASIPVGQERTMQSLYAGSLARTSFTLLLLGIAGAMALGLGVIGIYGVIAYVVIQRKHEIGIRAALGARPQDLARIFLMQGLALAGVGAGVGLLGAVVVGRLMATLLFGVLPTDIVAYSAALGVTLAAAALASWLPARRAAGVDPIATLRAE